MYIIVEVWFMNYIFCQSSVHTYNVWIDKKLLSLIEIHYITNYLLNLNTLDLDTSVRIKTTTAYLLLVVWGLLWLCDSEIVARAEEVSLSLTPPTHRQHPGLSDHSIIVGPHHTLTSWIRSIFELNILASVLGQIILFKIKYL